MTEILGRQPMPIPGQDDASVVSTTGVYRRHVVHALAMALAFWAPWGEASGTFFDVGLSRIFVGVAALFVVAQFSLGGWRLDGFPRSFNWWVLFLAGHTLIYYLLLEKGGLGFGYSGIKVYQQEAVGMTEEHGLGIARFFYLVVIGYALAKYFDSARRLQAFSVMYGLGLCAMLLFTSGYRSVGYTGGERFSGGFFNANAFAMTCWTALFLAVFLVRSGGRSKPKLLCAILIITVAGYGLLSSGSRSGLLGVFVGLAAVTAFSSLRRGAAVWLPVGFLLVGCTLIAIVPDKILDDFSERIAPAEIRETGGSERFEIWRSYIGRLDECALAGVGLNNGVFLVQRDWSIRRPTHNLFLKMLVEFGIVGLVLFVLALAHLIKMLWKVDGRIAGRSVVLGLIACWLVNIVVHDFFFARDTWIMFAFVAAFVRGTTTDEASCASDIANEPRSC